MADTASLGSAPPHALMNELDSTIIDRLPIGVCVCEAPSGRVVRYNRRAAELWGREPDLESGAILYCGAYRLYTPTGRVIDGAPMRQVVETGRPVRDQEVVIERPDGSRITVFASIDPLRDETGRVTGAVSLLQDTRVPSAPEAEPQQMHRELDAEKERLLEAFERSSAFMAVLRGPQHIFERANRHYYTLVGRADILGRSLAEALPEIADQGYVDVLDHVYRSGEPHIGRGVRVTLRQAPNGRLDERVVDFIFQPLRDAYGTVTGILIHGVDLTDHLRAEENLAWLTAEADRWRRLYETILSATPDLVYVFDLNYRFTYANKALLTTWGRTWKDSIGKTCLELGYPDWHATMHEREIDQVVETKRPIRGEVPFAGTQGERIYDYIFVPVFGENGEVEAVAGTTRDVTERKQMEEELQRRADELALSDRRKDEFIALLAHELRNPLAPIRNGLQILDLAEKDSEAVARVRGMMGRQLAHMVRLIDDLLDISRINENKLHLKKTDVLLEDVVQHAIETVRPAIDAADHQLEVRLPAKPILLEADLTRLAQVFSNLLSNSAKYTPKKGHIWLDAEHRGDRVEVWVTDNGNGIPAAALESVFDMFSQAHSSSDTAAGGLGIGLALVKNLVQMHGGSVSAASAGAGKGSKFTVSLPVVNSGEAALAAAKESPPSGRSDARYRVLVVDDNVDACDSMAMMMEMLGHTVITAQDGLAAVREAEAFRPDLILMDVGMPNLNGYEATRRIRETAWGKHINIHALTGWGQTSDRELSQAAGCDGHLVKPVDLQDLQRLLNRMGNKH